MSKQNKLRSARSRGPLLTALLGTRVLGWLFMTDCRKRVDARIDELRTYFAEPHIPSEEAKKKGLELLTEKWHNGVGEGMELYEYLGMTWEEYQLWVTKPSVFCLDSAREN